jgi:origin recognition complex subunit 5
VYGLPSTGKTSITRQIANDLSLAHAYINCAECITARHLYEKTASTVLEALGDDVERLRLQQQKLGRCENLAALSTQLQGLLEGRNGTFVLVLDGIDRQREAPPTLIPAIARLGELVCNAFNRIRTQC